VDANVSPEITATKSHSFHKIDNESRTNTPKYLAGNRVEPWKYSRILEKLVTNGNEDRKGREGRRKSDDVKDHSQMGGR
jgi:hypothetical protein